MGPSIGRNTEEEELYNRVVEFFPELTRLDENHKLIAETFRALRSHLPTTLRAEPLIVGGFLIQALRGPMAAADAVSSAWQLAISDYRSSGT